MLSSLILKFTFTKTLFFKERLNIATFPNLHIMVMFSNQFWWYIQQNGYQIEVVKEIT